MYKFLTTKQLSEAILSAPSNTVFDFTFDSCEEDFYQGEPTGWYGAKITTIFNEPSGVFVIGCYVDCKTILYNFGTNTAYSDDLVMYIKECFDDYCSECDYSSKLCVKVTDENKIYFPQLNRYDVEVVETLHKIFTIEAYNKKEAEHIIDKKLDEHKSDLFDDAPNRMFFTKESKVTTSLVNERRKYKN